MGSNLVFSGSADGALHYTRPRQNWQPKAGFFNESSHFYIRTIKKQIPAPALRYSLGIMKEFYSFISGGKDFVIAASAGFVLI